MAFWDWDDMSLLENWGNMARENNGIEGTREMLNQ